MALISMIWMHILWVLPQVYPVLGFTIQNHHRFYDSATTYLSVGTRMRPTRYHHNGPNDGRNVIPIPHSVVNPPYHHVLNLHQTHATKEDTEQTIEASTSINGNTRSNIALATTMTVDDTQDVRGTFTTSTTTTTTATEPSPNIKIVVIMNANARGVSASTIQVAQEVFGRESVFVTRSIPDVHHAFQTVVRSPPPQRFEHLLVVTMGGDGTLATTIQTMCQILLRSSSHNDCDADATNHNHHNNSVSSFSSVMSQLPIIAYVPLGTGNAVGSVVGCSDHSMMSSSSSLVSPTTTNRFRRMISFVLPRRTESRSLRRLRSTLRHIQETVRHGRSSSTTITTASIPITELPMIEISNHNFTDLCFFAGGMSHPIISWINVLTFVDDALFVPHRMSPHFFVKKKHTAGFDSLMLNDFKTVKNWSQRTGVFTGMLSSVLGYCVTLLVQTLPKTVFRSSHVVHVQVTTNQLNNTYWVDHRRGDFVQPCTTPNLYNGTTGIIAGSTVPYYGGKLRLFPFARISSDKLHLRIGRIHPLIGFFNIPKIFAGTYRDFSKRRFGVLDFIGNDFTIQVSSGSKDADTNSFPLQHSGESIGPVSSFRLRVVETPVRFLNLLPDR